VPHNVALGPDVEFPVPIHGVLIFPRNFEVGGAELAAVIFGIFVVLLLITGIGGRVRLNRYI
jgi:hypothetical protein